MELFSLLLALAECLPTRCRTKPPSPDLLGAMESSTNLLSGVWQLQVILAKADQFTLGYPNSSHLGGSYPMSTR